jgi:hypothetical protein
LLSDLSSADSRNQRISKKATLATANLGRIAGAFRLKEMQLALDEWRLPSTIPIIEGNLMAHPHLFPTADAHVGQSQ